MSKDCYTFLQNNLNIGKQFLRESQETVASHARKFQPRPGPTLATLAMVAVMLSLGVWQVQRLGWKTELIARIEARMAARPAPLPGRLDDPAAWEFRRVTLAGHFLHDREFLVGPRTHAGRAGYHLLVPFRRASGGVVFINRGWLPEGEKNIERPEGVVQAEGIVRLPEKSAFLPENDPAKNQWHWTDVEAMGKAAGVKPAIPAIVEAVAGMPGAFPLPAARSAEMRNDHRQYAIFWFGMACAMAAVYVLSSLKKPEGKNASL